MKKLLALFLVFSLAVSAMAQDSTTVAPHPKKEKKEKREKKPKKDWSKVSMSNRANDHFLIQFGYNGWTQTTDSMNTRGLPHSFNMYFMFDLPFKTDPRFSVGIGAGLGTDNVYFSKTYIDIAGNSNSTLVFQDVSNAEHYKKYKLETTYLEAPVELRFSSNPLNSNKSWKGAVGLKVGTLLAASTKGKTLLNSSGQTLNSIIVKEKSKRFFNSTRLAVTGRIGYGILSLYASYQINAFVKDGYGPDIRPFQIGITISGL